MNESKDQFGQIFNQAEMQIGTDMYQVQVEMGKAHANLLNAKAQNSKMRFVFTLLGSLVLFPAVIIVAYKFALGF